MMAAELERVDEAGEVPSSDFELGDGAADSYQEERR